MNPAAFDHLTSEQLRQLAAQLSQRVDHLETLNQRLNHELAVLRRHRFARRSERRHELSPQRERLSSPLTG